MSIRYKLAGWVRDQPILTYLSWEIASRLPFLLPHDKSYYGFKHFAKPAGGLFLDVGANNGITALGIRNVLPHYSVFSIEANARHRPSLEKVKRRLADFDYRIAGASDVAGEMTVFVPTIHGIVNHTAASSDPEYLTGALRRAYGEQKLAGLAITPHKVEAIRLDDLELAPDLVKIDIEGHELRALRGFENTIARMRPVILIEYTPKYFAAIEAFLAERDYQFCVYDRDTDAFVPFTTAVHDSEWTTSALQVNVFCVPKRR